MTVLRIVSGSANPGLASAVANYLGVESDGCSLQRFPDGELRATIISRYQRVFRYHALLSCHAGHGRERARATAR